MRSILALGLLSFATTAQAAPSLKMTPNPAKPGDAVLVELLGAGEQTEAPRVSLGNRRLDPYRTKSGWAAIAALPIDEPAGELTAKVAFADKQKLDLALEVEAPNFGEVSIDVEEIFVDPPAEFRERILEDQRAVAAAYARELVPLETKKSFVLPKKSKLTSEFGQLRMFNGTKNSQHLGADLSARPGDTVAASNDGEVVLVRDCFYSGKTIIVHHGAQLYTAYFHLSKTDVREGARVTRGQKLGAAGDTGRTTGPHIHFGVRIGEVYVDPIRFLKLRLPNAINRRAS